MSYYMICPNCGKGTIGRYATDNSLCDECSSDTDKLSVEKLQEIRVEELKDFNSKILQAELKNQKLQEQLNTAKKALTEIASTRQGIWRGGTLVGYEATEDAQFAIDALTAIGGDDGQ